VLFFISKNARAFYGIWILCSIFRPNILYIFQMLMRLGKEIKLIFFLDKKICYYLLPCIGMPI